MAWHDANEDVTTTFSQQVQAVCVAPGTYKNFKKRYPIPATGKCFSTPSSSIEIFIDLNRTGKDLCQKPSSNLGQSQQPPNDLKQSENSREDLKSNQAKTCQNMNRTENGPIAAGLELWELSQLGAESLG